MLCQVVMGWVVEVLKRTWSGTRGPNGSNDISCFIFSVHIARLFHIVLGNIIFVRVVKFYLGAGVIAGGNSSISDKWKKEFLPEHCVISVEVFDPANNSWTLGPDLSNALCGAGKHSGLRCFRSHSRTVLPTSFMIKFHMAIERTAWSFLSNLF